MAKYYQEKRTTTTTYRKITTRGSNPNVFLKTQIKDANDTALESWQICRKEAVDLFTVDALDGADAVLYNIDGFIIAAVENGQIKVVLDSYARLIPFKRAWDDAKRENPDAKPDWTFIKVQSDHTDIIDWNGTVGYRAFYSLYRPDAKSPRLKIPFIE